MCRIDLSFWQLSLTVLLKILFQKVLRENWPITELIIFELTGPLPRPNWTGQSGPANPPPEPDKGHTLVSLMNFDRQKHSNLSTENLNEQLIWRALSVRMQQRKLVSKLTKGTYEGKLPEKLMEKIYERKF